MATGLRCYHHCNCEDRPAVATCTRCGKALCAECADKLKSSDGQILCVDCLNAELAANAALADRAKNSVKRELIGIIVGFVIGIIIFAIICALSVEPIFIIISIWIPTTLASLFTIIKFISELNIESFIFKVLWFIGCAAISPIMFLWRVIRRLVDIANMKKYAGVQQALQRANNEFFQLARQQTVKLETPEVYRKKLEAQFADRLNEETQKKIAALEKEYEAKYNEDAENRAKEAATVAEMQQKYQMLLESRNVYSDVASMRRRGRGGREREVTRV